MAIEIKGMGATATSATGMLRLVRTEHDMRNFKPGDILATEMTSPDMMDLLVKAAGWVTMHGGRTCHAAVVARAMGKPCVVGLGDQFIHLKDGAFVTVDGKSGMVSVLD